MIGRRSEMKVPDRLLGPRSVREGGKTTRDSTEATVNDTVGRILSPVITVITATNIAIKIIIIIVVMTVELRHWDLF